jgi:hypothetical protein
VHKYINGVVIAWCVACSSVHGQAFSRPPETIRFERGFAPERYLTHTTILFGAATNANGVTTATATLRMLRESRPTRPKDDGQFSYQIHGVQEGAILPAMGELYRVDGIRLGKNPSMTWSRVERDKWPEKVSTNSAAVAVLLKSGTLDCSTSFPSGSGHGLILAGIEDADKKSGTKARLVVWRETRTGSKGTEATVKLDDLLLINGKGHKVLSIVPANEKTGVVGWVELDAVGIPEADLKRDKKAYITPTPVKK